MLIRKWKNEVVQVVFSPLSSLFARFLVLILANVQASSRERGRYSFSVCIQPHKAFSSTNNSSPCAPNGSEQCNSRLTSVHFLRHVSVCGNWDIFTCCLFCIFLHFLEIGLYNEKTTRVCALFVMSSDTNVYVCIYSRISFMYRMRERGIEFKLNVRSEISAFCVFFCEIGKFIDKSQK
jgi:hypothetical protein